MILVIFVLVFVVVERQWHRFESAVFPDIVEVFILQPAHFEGSCEHLKEGDLVCVLILSHYYLKKFHRPRRMISREATSATIVCLCN